MNLVLFGIQGSGKGTQAKLLAENYNYIIFETGAALRQLAQENSPLGLKVKSTIEAGNLVSSELVMEIVENFVSANRDKKIIFDGIPRNEDQYVAFSNLAEKLNLEIQAVHFELDREEATNRLLKRAKIENRADDTEDIIKKRIEIFYTDTLPIIQKFTSLLSIDASQSIEEIFEDLAKQLNL